MMLRSLRADRRGAIAIFFAVTLAGSIIAIGSVLNMAQVASVRAGLQRTLDEAALSGAAAYSANSASFKTLAIGMAGRVFCNGVTTLPMGASVVAAAGTQACATGNGPLVTAVTDSYIPGTPGLSLGQCGGTYLPAAPYVCGFILTVSATVTVNGIFPSFFGSAITVSRSAMATNPFINFAKIFSLPNGVKSTAKYANSIWVYLLLMSSNGGPAFSTSNPGARPDDSACIGGTGSVSAAGGPDQVTCGSYVMLASTMYAGKGANYSVTVRGVTTTYNNGVVVNLTTPVGVTATTPLGIAFPSIAGGNYVQYSAPGVYGYAVTNLGNNPPTYVTAANACIYPYNEHVYSTVGQVWTTAAAANGGPGFKPVMPWGPLITHWFYSSFLSNNLPPSQPEIALQAAGLISVASIPSDPA